MTIVVAYDVSQDSRRARMSAALQMWGDRIQRSVFICLIEPDDVTALVVELERIMDPDTDLLHVFPLCAACDARAVARGQATLEEPPAFWMV